jgi:hypothetical protein
MFGYASFAEVPFASFGNTLEKSYVFVTGNSATAILGPLSLGANGLQATALVNSVIVSIPINVNITGLEAFAYLGDGTVTAGGYALVWALVDTTQHP